MSKAEYGMCTTCGYVMFPIPSLSPCGHDADVEREPLDESGVVFSWTNARVGKPGGLMVMADFLSGKLRVTAPLRGAETVSIGERVRVHEGADVPYHLEPAS